MIFLRDYNYGWTCHCNYNKSILKDNFFFEYYSQVMESTHILLVAPSVVNWYTSSDFFQLYFNFDPSLKHSDKIQCITYFDPVWLRLEYPHHH